MSRPLTYEERTAPSGETISVPVIPPGAPLDEIEANRVGRRRRHHDRRAASHAR